MRAQPSAEIVRVECAKCKRECDLSGARATLCGDRARRAREMQNHPLWACLLSSFAQNVSTIGVLLCGPPY